MPPFIARRPSPPEAIRRLDLHGLNRHQVEVMVNSALRQTRGLYRLHLVHGHRSGTVLRDFVRQRFAQDPRILRIEGLGDGATDFVLREF